MTDTIMIYVTFGSAEEAQRVSKALVEKRLVACANIMSPHRSYYWWQEEVQSSEEIAVIYKTKEPFFTKVEQEITTLHSYDVPCIVSWPIAQGHNPFLQWINDQTDPPKK